jgi:hypothetical protein
MGDLAPAAEEPFLTIDVIGSSSPLSCGFDPP